MENSLIKNIEAEYRKYDLPERFRSWLEFYCYLKGEYDAGKFNEFENSTEITFVWHEGMEERRFCAELVLIRALAFEEIFENLPTIQQSNKIYAALHHFPANSEERFYNLADQIRKITKP